MAASLKTSTFTMTKICGSMLVFAAITALYLKYKLDIFFNNCKPVEEERTLLTWLTSALRIITDWTWSAQKDYNQHHHHADLSTSEESVSSLTVLCQSSLVQILTHIVVIQMWEDVKRLWNGFADVLTSLSVTLQDGLSTIFLAMKETFCTCVQIFWRYSDSLQDGFRLFWGNIVELFKSSATSKNHLCVIATVIFILSSVLVSFMYCWKKKLKPTPVIYKDKSDSECINIDKKFAVYTPQTLYYKPTLVPSFDVADDKHNGWCLDFEPSSLKLHKEVDGQAMGDHRTFKDDHGRRSLLTAMKFLVYVTLTLLCVSIPWEFCRLYQIAVGNRAAVASAGAPAECGAMTSLTLLQTLKIWLSQQLAWSHDISCDRYYHAMFVDPLWEVTPLMVLMSVVTRCVVHPAELLSAGLGRALRQLLTQIPLHWQPVILLLALTFALLALLTTCRYRLHVPLLFRIEPRTPVHLAAQGTHSGGGGGGGSRGGRQIERRKRAGDEGCCRECHRAPCSGDRRGGGSRLRAEEEDEEEEETLSRYDDQHAGRLARSRSASRPGRGPPQLTFHRPLSSTSLDSLPVGGGGGASASRSASRGTVDKENVAGTPTGRVVVVVVKGAVSNVSKTEKAQQRLRAGVSGSRTPLGAVSATSNADVTSESDVSLTSESDRSPEWTPARAARGKRQQRPKVTETKSNRGKASGRKRGK